MQRVCQRIGTVGLLLALVAAIASNAHASRGISLSSQTIGAGGTLTFNGGAWTCNALFTYRTNSNTISKTTGVNYGSITSGSITNCTGLATGGTVLAPINLQYSSFTGTLPNISEINSVSPNFAISFNTIAGTCLYGGSVRTKKLLVVLGITIFRYISESVTKRSGSALCPSTLTIAGDLTTLGTVPRVALI